MTDRQKRREPARDRARKRAIRAHAAAWGVSYSVAARQLGLHSRTTQVTGCGQSTVDTEQAVVLPCGRAAHLGQRFTPARGQHGAGPFYYGLGREATLAMTYLAVCWKHPYLVPDKADLAWIAGLGESAAVDLACTGVDRAARRILGGSLAGVTRILAGVLIQAAAGTKPDLRQPAVYLSEVLTAMRQPDAGGLPVTGARQTLDAVLVAVNDGFAPGARVQVGDEPGTVVGVHWEASGPPSAYDVRLDNVLLGQIIAEPGSLSSLSGQDAFPGN